MYNVMTLYIKAYATIIRAIVYNRPNVRRVMAVTARCPACTGV